MGTGPGGSPFPVRIWAYVVHSNQANQGKGQGQSLIISSTPRLTATLCLFPRKTTPKKKGKTDRVERDYSS